MFRSWCMALGVADKQVHKVEDQVTRVVTMRVKMF